MHRGGGGQRPGASPPAPRGADPGTEAVAAAGPRVLGPERGAGAEGRRAALLRDCLRAARPAQRLPFVNVCPAGGGGARPGGEEPRPSAPGPGTPGLFAGIPRRVARGPRRAPCPAATPAASWTKRPRNRSRPVCPRRPVPPGSRRLPFPGALRHLLTAAGAGPCTGQRRLPRAGRRPWDTQGTGAPRCGLPGQRWAPAPIAACPGGAARGGFSTADSYRRHGTARLGAARPGGFRAACSRGEAPSVILNGPGRSGCVRSGGPRRTRSPARCAPRVPGKRSLRSLGSGRPGRECSAEKTEAASPPPRAPPGGPGRSVSRAEEPRGTAAGSRHLPSAPLHSRELLERCEIGWKCTGWEGSGGAFLKAAQALSRAAFRVAGGSPHPPRKGQVRCEADLRDSGAGAVTEVLVAFIR